MSERLEWKPTDKDIETAPVIKIDIESGSEYLLRPWNTSLYTFLGHLAVWNHIYHFGNIEGTDKEYAFYLPENWYASEEWKTTYGNMAEYMLSHDYTSHLNLTSVSETDVKEITRLMQSDVRDTDYIPDTWL